MKPIYGVTNNKGIHTDTSNTLLGAKQYATRNGYRCVSVRHEYYVTLLEYKEGSKWIKYKEFLELFN